MEGEVSVTVTAVPQSTHLMHYATQARCSNHSLDWKIAQQGEWGAPRLLRGTFLAFRDDSAGIVSNSFLDHAGCSRTADKGWSSNSGPGRVSERE